MLSLLAIAMLATFMVSQMTGRVSALVGLTLIPVVFGLLAGFGFDLAPMIVQGVQQLAPTGVMLCFAILYFCVMSDAGLFDPLIRWIVRVVDHDPVRIVVGTAVLALIISLDGDGSTTYLICCAALLPLYRRVGLNPLTLACLLTLSVSITNLAPWGGPTARIASVLKLDVGDVFIPLIPAMLTGAAFVLGLAYVIGLRERARLAREPVRGDAPQIADPDVLADQLVTHHAHLRRPKLLFFNLALTAVLLGCMSFNILPLTALFLVGAPLALVINYPSKDQQMERLAAHGPNILKVTSIIFGAGVFVGILNGTGMSTALATGVVDIMPPGLGPYLAPITALLAMPFTLVMGNVGYFFGVVPVLAEAAAHYGIPPVEVARAALLDGAVHFFSPLTASTYLLVALCGVELGKHQRYTLPWAVVLGLVMQVAAMLTGAVGFGQPS